MKSLTQARISKRQQQAANRLARHKAVKAQRQLSIAAVTAGLEEYLEQVPNLFITHEEPLQLDTPSSEPPVRTVPIMTRRQMLQNIAASHNPSRANVRAKLYNHQQVDDSALSLTYTPVGA